MLDNSIFSDDDIQTVVEFVDVMRNLDSEGKVYNFSTAMSDSLINVIESNTNFSSKQKDTLKRKVNKRQKNQQAVEELIKKASDINRGKQLL